MPARRGGIDLRERLEELRLVTVRDPYTCIAHLPAAPDSSVPCPALHAQPHDATLGELTGIAQEIEQALPELCHVHVDRGIRILRGDKKNR